MRGHPSNSIEFRRLLENLPAGAYMCDPTGLITYFNAQSVQLWGRAPKLHDPADRFCGSFKLFSADGEPIRHDQCWMALALQNNDGYNGKEILVERPSGERLTVLAYANPIRDDSGQLLGAINVLVDISDRKRAEQALQVVDRSKDEFLATLAHELRNPLAPIRGAVHLLRQQKNLPPETQWAVNVIDRQMQTMARLIDDLMDTARISHNKLDLRPQRIELSDAVRAAIETSQSLIANTGHKLSVRLPAEPIILDADLTRLTQVLSVLLNNAAQYTAQGGRIWLTVERQGSDAVVTVRDTGIGISPQTLPGIFDLFTQVTDPAHSSHAGLGIGLALAKKLVELHNGTIEARSNGLGKGSEFIVRLPVVCDIKPQHPIAETAPDLPIGLMGLRVLVVDDHPDSGDCLSRMMRQAGNDVRIAHDGLEAIRAAAAFQPDVILLDIGLPRMNGYEAASHIRKQTWGGKATLIAVTGWGQDGDRKKSKDAGFDHHLVKPVAAEALLKLLGTIQNRTAGPSI